MMSSLSYQMLLVAFHKAVSLDHFFFIYINYLPDDIDSTLYMYADDTNVYRELKSDNDVHILQENLIKMSIWSDEWLLKFHLQKCTSIAIGSKDVVHAYKLPSVDEAHQILQVGEFKDIGVTVNSLLILKQHICKEIDTANMIIGIIRRS